MTGTVTFLDVSTFPYMEDADYVHHRPPSVRKHECLLFHKRNILLPTMVSRAALLCQTFDDESDTGNYDGRPQSSQIEFKTDDGHSDIHKRGSQLSAMASSKPSSFASRSSTPWLRTILTFLHKEFRSSHLLRTHQLVLLWAPNTASHSCSSL